MANVTYDSMWQEAMAELSEQLHVEGVDNEADMAQTASSTKANVPEVTILQAFQHFACLYIKYIQIFKKLENCYDNMIHPQKRIHVKKVLELVMRRILELKNDLVKWNPPNSYVKIPNGPEEAFPWEYVHLDDILVDLKLPPDILELNVPKYFREDTKSSIDQRDRLVSGYMRLKHNTDKMFVPDKYETAAGVENMTLDRAIEIIQRNERGRQGAERAALVKAMREKERQSRMYDATAQIEMDPEIAATNLQRMLKGFVSRSEAVRERENELMFIGMTSRKDNVEVLNYELDMAYRRRKQEQAENKDIYEKALDDLKEIIMDEEGPEKRDEFREERTLWFTDQIAQEKFPEDLDDFYTIKKIEPDPEADAKDAGGKKGGDKKGDKGGDKKGDKKGGDKKGKGAKDEDEQGPAMPKLQGKTELTEKLSGFVEEFESTWDNRDEGDNFQQRHDTDLAKTVVRPGVYDDIRKQVDEMLLMNLKKIKLQMAPGGKGKNGKKGKKGKKGKGKKGKDKKKKPLPGDKIAELKGLDTDHMLSVLIENQLVVRTRDRTLNSLVGDFNYLGSMQHNADRKDEGAWEPPEPSIAQIRSSVTEYCVWPNGSSDIKGLLEPMIKSVMFYGPAGTGKTHAAEAVANELGALLIHLSPDKLRGLFGGKSGPTKLIHMVMTVARDPTMQPVVIYVDECEQFFTGGKKNKDKDGPSRFKKDFILYKNQALLPQDRVVIIGSTRNPENGDIKDMRTFFDKFLYFPYPDYSSRLMIWRYHIDQQMREGLKKADPALMEIAKNAKHASEREELIRSKIRSAMTKIDLSSLAHISEGYSAGAIARTIRAIVTNRRVAMLRNRPLSNMDFLDNLSLQDVTYHDDRIAFAAFTKVISGLEERRKKVESLVAGDSEEKKGGDKKKK